MRISYDDVSCRQPMQYLTFYTRAGQGVGADGGLGRQRPEAGAHTGAPAHARAAEEPRGLSPVFLAHSTGELGRDAFDLVSQLCRTFASLLVSMHLVSLGCTELKKVDLVQVYLRMDELLMRDEARPELEGLAGDAASSDAGYV